MECWKNDKLECPDVDDAMYDRLLQLEIDFSPKFQDLCEAFIHLECKYCHNNPKRESTLKHLALPDESMLDFTLEKEAFTDFSVPQQLNRRCLARPKSPARFRVVK